MPAVFVPLIVVIFVVILLIMTLVQWLINNSKPQLASKVRIIEVDTRRSGKYVKNRQTYAINLTPTYKVSFEFTGGNRKSIIVPVKNNDWVCEGISGILTLQGTRFINFEETE